MELWTMTKKYEHLDKLLRPGHEFELPASSKARRLMKPTTAVARKAKPVDSPPPPPAQPLTKREQAQEELRKTMQKMAENHQSLAEVRRRLEALEAQAERDAQKVQSIAAYADGRRINGTNNLSE
jgi:hypothetical protein